WERVVIGFAVAVARRPYTVLRLGIAHATRDIAQTILPTLVTLRGRGQHGGAQKARRVRAGHAGAEEAGGRIAQVVVQGCRTTHRAWLCRGGRRRLRIAAHCPKTRSSAKLRSMIRRSAER